VSLGFVADILLSVCCASFKVSFPQFNEVLLNRKSACMKPFHVNNSFKNDDYRSEKVKGVRCLVPPGVHQIFSGMFCTHSNDSITCPSLCPTLGGRRSQSGHNDTQLLQLLSACANTVVYA
jgi:hypothetical protein